MGQVRDGSGPGRPLNGPLSRALEGPMGPLGRSDPQLLSCWKSPRGPYGPLRMQRSSTAILLAEQTQTSLWMPSSGTWVNFWKYILAPSRFY